MEKYMRSIIKEKSTSALQKQYFGMNKEAKNEIYKELRARGEVKSANMLRYGKLIAPTKTKQDFGINPSVFGFKRSKGIFR